MTRFHSSRFVAAALACGLFLLVTPPARAAEEAARFLEGLRQRGYYEIAAEYLDQIKDSPLVSAEFKKNIAYEQGVTLVSAARASGDPRTREELFERARVELEAYVKGHGGTELAAKANTQLANVLVERARAALKKAESPSQAANKSSLRGEARQYLDDAEKLFATADNFYTETLKKLPKIIKESDPLFEKRQAYRASLVQSRLLMATVVYEKSKAYDAGGAEAKKLLKNAADQYGDMFEKYGGYLAGLYARFYQGRCYEDMGEYTKAIGFYEDVAAQPDTAPAFRTLISKAYAGLGACWIAEKNYDEAIKRLGEWAAKARGAELHDADWLAVKYQRAVALEKKAAGVKDAEAKRKLLRDARLALRDVTKYPNDFEKEAQALYARLGSDDGEEDAPKTFAEAFEAGREAINMMQAAQAAIPIAGENNKKAVPKLQKQLEQSRDDAKRLFELSLGLVDGETDTAKVNLARYYLCYLNWEEQRYYDAAIFGEFLASKYPQSAGARSAAKIAMAAYLAKYNAEDNANQDFDARRIVGVAQLIARRWPNSSEADEAYNMLVSFMIQQEKFAEAEQYLQKISAKYPKRGEAELKVGQSYWVQYARKVRLPDDQRPPRAELDALKQKARTTLETGFERMRASGASGPTAASAGLSLAQIYLDTSQPQLAVEVLEDKKLGPLTLLEKNAPATRREGYAESAYKAALRAYVTVAPPQLEKAEKIMTALEASVAKQGDGSAEKLTLIFIALGRQLEEQLDVLKAEGKDDQIKKVAKSFEVFLDRVAGREKGNTWASRNWVASTYYNLGTGFDGKSALRKQADAYYNKAVAAYQKILSEVEKNPSFAPSEDAVLAVKMRIAACQRKLGQYREALDLLAEVLGKKPMMLEAQVAAAYAYQERGNAEDPKWYYYARQGGRKDPNTGKERIWGWGKLSQITARYPQYRDVFHEARYNLTKSRLAEAGKQTSATKKRDLLERAKADLSLMTKLYPKMGGPEWLAKYEQLMKDIQRALNEKPEGLAVFKSKSS